MPDITPVAITLGLLASCGGSSANAMPDAPSSVDASDAPVDAGTSPFRIALSISPFSKTVLAAGVQFTDGTTTATTLTDLERLYVAHGANELYVRVATEQANPAGSASDHSLANAVATAALARSLGLPLDPELGLWADYGDITCQPPPDFSGYPGITVPGPWNTLTIDQMVPVLRAYGAYMAHTFLDAGTHVSIWDLGNEIDFGTAGVSPKGTCAAWVAPDGVDPAIGMTSVADLLTMTEADRESWLGTHIWPREAKLLAAVADGVRSVDPNARFATHVSGVSAQNAALGVAFYRAMDAGGFHADEIGFSWYPSSTAAAGRVAAFRATMDAVRATFARPIFIAELAYPAGPIGGGAYDSWVNALPPYPVSPAGQAQFLTDLSSYAVASGISGIRYWAPDVVVPGWGGLAIFSISGATATANPAIDAIVHGIATPNAAAFHD